MDSLNKLNQVPLANLSSDELNEIKNTEEKMGKKYYLIAFEK
jgi:hypothetical protein